MATDISKVLFELIVILVLAKVGAYIFELLKQPSVLGELCIGILLGNLAFITGGRIEIFNFFRTDEFIHLFSEIGVIILLFEIGLQSNIRELLKVGGPALRVAVVGVLLPMGLGFWSTTALGLSKDANVALFLGATLTATSVGITARVLKDLGKLNLPESKVILGAAVIDDVLGLIVLAVVTGIVGGGSLGFGSILQTSFMAILFLGGSILIGLWVAPRLINIFQRFEVRGNKLAISLGICFSMALLAKKAGLAPIVGAFAGGLILDNVYFVKYKEQRPLEEILSPIGDLFVPVFFVVIGMGVHLELIFQSQIILIGTLLLAVAIVGKFVAGWAVLPQKMNFAAIGFGMIPRGEVGFIFASEGLRLGVLSNQLYAVIIFLVMATTLISPPLLNLSLKRTFVTPKS